MARTVWKYTLIPDETIDIEGGAPRVVHVGVDPLALDRAAKAREYGVIAPVIEANVPTVWVELDPDGRGEMLSLTFIGTGHPVPEDMTHVGSCITPAGLVWHCYAR
jgi:hypothetical protein